MAAPRLLQTRLCIHVQVYQSTVPACAGTHVARLLIVLTFQPDTVMAYISNGTREAMLLTISKKHLMVCKAMGFIAGHILAPAFPCTGHQATRCYLHFLLFPGGNSKDVLPAGCLCSLLSMLWASNVSCATSLHAVIYAACYHKHWYVIVMHVLKQLRHTEGVCTGADLAPASDLLPAAIVADAAGALILLLPAANPGLEP